ASIHGAAMGAGLGMALCCDFRVASRSARFGSAFVKIGLATDFGMSWQLPRIVGPAKARQFLLSGDILDATTAEALGLATRVVEDESLAQETLAWAQRFAQGPLLAHASIKRNLTAAESFSLQATIE